jgi:hypothetical protein
MAMLSIIAGLERRIQETNHEENNMSTAPKGPASYFPSIEAKYGHPVAHWFALLGEHGNGLKHMELVNWLKSEHGLGHGHANALVAYHLARRG